MTDERLEEIKAHLEEVEIWRNAGSGDTLILEGGYTRPFLPECVAEIDHLRAELERLRTERDYLKASLEEEAEISSERKAE